MRNNGDSIFFKMTQIFHSIRIFHLFMGLIYLKLQL